MKGVKHLSNPALVKAYRWSARLALIDRLKGEPVPCTEHFVQQLRTELEARRIHIKHPELEDDVKT